MDPKSGSVGLSSELHVSVEQLKLPHGRFWISVALGYTRASADGTRPEKPGSTLHMPKLRARARMACCSCRWPSIQSWLSGPPQPRMLFIRCHARKAGPEK